MMTQLKGGAWSATYDAIDCIFVAAEFCDNGTAAVAFVAGRLVQFPDFDRGVDAALAGRQIASAL